MTSAKPPGVPPLRAVTWPELAAYLRSVRVTRGLREIVLHHTWEPTAARYRGQQTWDAIRRFHMVDRGWSDIGYHLGIAPDESLWLLRPIPRQGAHVKGNNRHTVGVVLLGNFDEEDPHACGLTQAARVVALLLDRFHLPVSAVRFHREFADKTCPGTRLDLNAFRELVQAVADSAQGDSHD
jgi:hypothetical protein